MARPTENPDNVYIYNRDAKPHLPVRVLAQMSWPRASGPGQGTIRLIKTKASYSTVAFLIKRTAAMKVLSHLETTKGPIYSSDGALRKACALGQLEGAHFEADIDGKMDRINIIEHLPPVPKGGSRITPCKRPSSA